MWRHECLASRHALFRHGSHFCVVQMKNKIGMLLMEAGVSYNKQKLHIVKRTKSLLRDIIAANAQVH
jgi:hypothetical protein